MRPWRSTNSEAVFGRPVYRTLGVMAKVRDSAVITSVTAVPCVATLTVGASSRK